jgi:hypothetical protein
VRFQLGPASPKKTNEPMPMLEVPRILTVERTPETKSPAPMAMFW